MKRLLLMVLCLAIFCPDLEAARKKKRKKKRRKRAQIEHPLKDYNYGAGLAIGAGINSGISGMMKLDHKQFIQAQLGFNILRSDISVTSDYVLDFANVLPELSDLGFYIGVGGMFSIADDYSSLAGDSNDGTLYLGVRAPTGMYLVTETIPLQIFGELVPGLLVYPETTLTLVIALGVRYLF